MLLIVVNMLLLTFQVSVMGSNLGRLKQLSAQFLQKNQAKHTYCMYRLNVPILEMSEEDACSREGRCSDGNGTDNNAIFQHHAENQENEVKQEHGGTQCLIHLPVTGCDGNDDKEKHDKEQHNCAEEPVAADGDRGQAVDGRVHQPRDGKPFKTA